MQKDFKIGTALGLLIVAVVSLWLSVQPKLSIKARLGILSPPDDIIPPQQISTSPHPLAAVTEPNLPPADKTTDRIQIIDTSQQTAIIAEQPVKPSSPIDNNSQKPEPQRFHIVQKGDTLSEISYRYYGTAAKWQKIFEANRSILKNPDKLTPGTKLIIPD